jgi:hypothetical protein
MKLQNARLINFVLIVAIVALLIHGQILAAISVGVLIVFVNMF